MTPRRSATSAVVMMVADAPSLIWLALPAVMLPFLSNAGRSPARDSMVVSPRTPSSWATTRASPRRWGTVTGMISPSK